MKKLLQLKRKLLVGTAILIAAGAMMARFTTPGNVAQTSANHRDPKMRTRTYATSAQNVAREIEELVPTLRTYGRAWKIVSSSTRNGVTTIACEVPVLVFTDDLFITIRDESEHSSLDIRSASRVGKSDMGENRRHIMQLLSQFDKQLPTKSRRFSQNPHKLATLV